MPNNWTDAQIQQTVAKNMENHPQSIKNTKDEVRPNMTENKIRGTMVIGCGDAGCNIASDIKQALPDVYTITYNTSDRNKDFISADDKIYELNEDGSGKDRSLSKEIFKDKSYKELVSQVNNVCTKIDIQYIIVTTSVDGGTGSGVSPVVAKLIHDNALNSDGNPIPVIIIGVYPRNDEDAMSQFNALSWQADVEKTELPYMIFDNNISKIVRNTKDKTDGNLVIHKIINAEIVKIVKLISGNTYGNSTFMIDNRDLYMILNHCGKRVVFAQNTVKPAVNQNLDDYVLAMLEENHQPIPNNIKGMGVFVKGPSDLIKHVDTSMKGVASIYGEPMVHYNHLEESDMVVITILLSGCDIPEDRMYTMKERYNDIMNPKVVINSSAESILEGINNPFGVTKPVKKNTDGGINSSALDL